MAIDDQQPKRYEISSVLDFLKVPPERLEDCLEEFKTYLGLKRLLVAYFGIFEVNAKVEGEPLDEGVEWGPFIWIDDGVATTNVTVDFVDVEDGGMEVRIQTKSDEPS